MSHQLPPLVIPTIGKHGNKSFSTSPNNDIPLTKKRCVQILPPLKIQSPRSVNKLHPSPVLKPENSVPLSVKLTCNTPPDQGDGGKQFLMEAYLTPEDDENSICFLEENSLWSLESPSGLADDGHVGCPFTGF